uniref:Nuclear pore glycoprotein p62 n=1 Tax=Tetraodon nigroviridis TaxID=99883 RepID=H3C3G2_TETNG
GFTFGQSSAGFSFGTQKTTAAATGTTFGMTSSTPAAPGGGFSFGTPTPTPAGAATGAGTAVGTAAGAPGATNSFSFGAAAKSTVSGGGFAFGAPAAPSVGLGSAPQAPASGLTLGSSAAPAGGAGFTLGAGLSAQTTAAPAPGGGFSFGTAPASQPAAAAPAAATAAPAATGTGSSFGGFAFGSTKVQVTTPAAPAAPSGGGFAFGTSAPSNLTLGSQTQPTSAAAPVPAPVATAAATTTASTGFPLGSVVTLATSTSTAATTAAAGGLAFTLKPLGTAMMTYVQLEGLINKWSLELEDQERHFLQQATQVNAWDRMLVENGEKITALHKEMEKVKLDQRRLNQELDFILSQQKELEDLLCPLEESVKEQSGTIYMQNADEERERTYKLAENVDAQLKRMSQDLKEIIEHLNTSSGPADSSDPLQQICKILNTHMDSLQWIDQNSVLLQRRVEEVSKLCDNQRKEQEKTFRLTFD